MLSFAVIMLNTSLHNPNVRDKPGLERFVAMNRGINEGGDLPEELLRVRPPPPPPPAPSALSLFLPQTLLPAGLPVPELPTRDHRLTRGQRGHASMSISFLFLSLWLPVLSLSFSFLSLSGSVTLSGSSCVPFSTCLSVSLRT